MTKIILATLGLSGVLFALMVGFIAWLDSGTRRKNIRPVSRILLWTLLFPCLTLLSLLSGLALAHILGAGSEINQPYFTIMKFGAIAMAPIGLFAGLIAQFLLKHMDA